ncbi:nitrate reductase [Lonsdalea populi]|uniref:nitrate reductase n=1 Tax=Lonsdalea TaxID=1082702 RepID=UPI000DCA584F|nr:MULTISPECIES: nitrate reductase [Lonsdalea]RAT14606.1 nitrate reductase [Lonsdalea quercina]RAT28391.1 nitrate reductase [Lonsdalea populi]RAT34211.1 nitrate reductase [Lonsdalea populi]RAT47401.1 nitrate reductase [Lonsdalea populi]RAT53478.1 nitrate reductase [Lonsdalea populi]
MSQSPTSVATTCAYCGVGCGVRMQLQDTAFVAHGEMTHPANLGRLCVKGSALGETLGLEGRLLRPEIDRQPVSWSQALDAVADGLRAVIDQHGPQAVAFYGSGQLLTEDYYVANKLMKGFIGSGNMDTNSRLCMASAVAGYKRAFGADVVPCDYQDLEQADCVILTGSNTAWAHPVVYQRLALAKKSRPGMCIVVIDPRQTATCDIADLHLPLRPGSDAALFCGVLNAMAGQGCLDDDFLQQHTQGAEETLAAVKAWTLAKTADFCCLSQAQLQVFYQFIADSDRLVTLYSMGINQSSSGVDKCNAIINLHLATGKIGRAGCGPFSITGQPNAMGGREVGGLANQLAAHMGFTAEEIDRVGRFWHSDNVAKTAGLNAVDLFRAIEEGRVKALWIMGTNPLVSLPDADRVRAGLARCPLVIVSDIMRDTDTTRAAHICLPALGWGEKNGTVTNSVRCVSRQRSFLPPPGEAKADWWIISQVARRLGFTEAFNYQHPAEIFREHARLSGFENQGRRAFDISGLAQLSNSQWDDMSPVQWPVNVRYPHGMPRLFADGKFYHPDGRARLIAITPRLPINHPSAAYPLVMNTGRVRDQWHTMTRTGKSARLMQHLSEPFCQFHPDDCPAAQAGDLLRVSSSHGWLLLRADSDSLQPRGSLFVPMHWSSQFSQQARVNALIEAHTDPLSGQPESKQMPVRMQRWNAAWHAEVFLRTDLATPPSVAYWSRITQPGVTHFTLADSTKPEDWIAWLDDQFGIGQWICQSARMGDEGFNLLAWKDGELQLAFYAHINPPMPNRQAIVAAFAWVFSDAPARLALLAGRAEGGKTPTGAILCSCFGVGEIAIADAVRQGCHSAAQLGAALKCGTNCGSCIPELKKIIAKERETLMARGHHEYPR